MYLVNRVYSTAEGTCGSGVMDTHTVHTNTGHLQPTSKCHLAVLEALAMLI